MTAVPVEYHMIVFIILEVVIADFTFVLVLEFHKHTLPFDTKTQINVSTAKKLVQGNQCAELPIIICAAGGRGYEKRRELRAERDSRLNDRIARTMSDNEKFICG